MKSVFKIVILFFFIACTKCFADENKEEIFENVFESISIESNVSENADALEYYVQNPIDLQKTTSYELSNLPGISYTLALKIIDMVQVRYYNTYRMISDSLALSGYQERILRLCSYLKMPVEESRPVTHFNTRVRIYSRLEEARGFATGAYLGAPIDYYQRTTYKNDPFETGILVSRDAGEIHFADFYTAYASYKSGNLKLYIGDYTIESGMGSLFWRSFGYRKGIEVIAPALQYGGGIRPYRSSTEAGFLRGIAAEYNIQSTGLKVSAWLSWQDRDATIDTSTNTVSSIYNSGLFRTNSELRKKEQLSERISGVNLEFDIGGFKLGALACYQKYSAKADNSLSASFDGKEGLPISLYSYTTFSDLSVGMELSRDSEGNTGIKASLEKSCKGLRYSLAFRSFSKDYWSEFGYNFGEQSRPANEIGLYAALDYKFLPWLRFSGYTDIYRTYGPVYTIPVPVRGIDCLLLTKGKFARNNFYLLLKYEKKSDRRNNDAGLKRLFMKERTSLRLEFSVPINEFLFRMRYETVYTSFENSFSPETGNACFAELKYSLKKWASLSSRMTFFCTDSYGSAIWQYEYSMPGYMTTSGFIGEGTRFIAKARFMPSEYFDIYIIYAVTSRCNINYTGSGYEKTNGGKSSKLFIQIEADF